MFFYYKVSNNLIKRKIIKLLDSINNWVKCDKYIQNYMNFKGKVSYKKNSNVLILNSKPHLNLIEQFSYNDTEWIANTESEINKLWQECVRFFKLKTPIENVNIQIQNLLQLEFIDIKNISYELIENDILIALELKFKEHYNKFTYLTPIEPFEFFTKLSSKCKGYI